jgi:hypothetical protein
MHLYLLLQQDNFLWLQQLYIICIEEEKRLIISSYNLETSLNYAHIRSKLNLPYKEYILVLRAENSRYASKLQNPFQFARYDVDKE